MILINETPFPAFLFRTSIDDQRMAAAAIVRVTYDLAGGPRPATDQPWIVSPNHWTGPEGPMEHDAVFDRGGCDVLLFGKARSPTEEAVTTLDVSVEIDDLPSNPSLGQKQFRRSLRVFGDRTWVQRDGHLAPSDPAPFTEMPLDLTHAFGGTSEFDGLDVPYPDNPLGKGFYWDEADAAERGVLPNIEAPEALIRKWDDRPDPVGVGMCPLNFGPRVRSALVTDDKGGVRDIKNTIYNVAFPGMIIPAASPGALIRISGMSPSPLEFILPRDQLSAVARVGDVEHEDPFRIDQIGVEVDRDRMFVTYRYTFTYVVRPGDVRRCAVKWAPASTQSS